MSMYGMFQISVILKAQSQNEPPRRKQRGIKPKESKINNNKEMKKCQQT